eukprot:3941728-Rhodomonas_salina.2
MFLMVRTALRSGAQLQHRFSGGSSLCHPPGLPRCQWDSGFWGTDFVTVPVRHKILLQRPQQKKEKSQPRRLEVTRAGIGNGLSCRR